MARLPDLTLKYPVERGGETIERLSMRRPKARDLRELEDGRGTPSERLFRLISDLAEQPVEVIEELDAEDFAAVNAELQKVLPQAPTPPPT